MEHLKKPNLKDVTVTGGMWEQKDRLNRETSIYSVYDRFSDTGRFSAIINGWHEGMEHKPHIYWDSDVAKWLEGAAYIIAKHPDARLEAMCDETIEAIAKRQDADGYFNSYFQQCEPDAKFTRRVDHEMYCCGHFIEAAAAYAEATGKTLLLDVVKKYVDLIEKVFIKEKSAPFFTPGHEEIELALVRLYEYTNDKKYLEMSKYFIDERGRNKEDNYEWNTEYALQDYAPVRDMTTAEGHSVRACYLYSAMTDEAREYSDDEMLSACEKIFDSIIYKRMYITGGIGSTYQSEAFTLDYDLPDKTAYTETCAAISLAFFSERMSRTILNSKYADTFERALYNGILSGVSLDGKRFFYCNPLKVIPRLHYRNKCMTKPHREFQPYERVEVFDCSCCPPNINRFISSLGRYIYACDETKVVLNQFIENEAEFDGVKISVKTDYPMSGAVKINASGMGDKKLLVRIPAWCETFNVNKNYELKDGYAYFSSDNGSIELSIEFDMPVTFVEADPRVEECAGKIAVCRGPVVYCAESCDNGENLSALALDILNPQFGIENNDEFENTITVNGFRNTHGENMLYSKLGSGEKTNVRIKMIPFHAFANRGGSEMFVWMNKQ